MPPISGWKLIWYGSFPVRVSGVFQFFYDRFPYKWENGAIFFKQSTGYWTPIFVEKSIKKEFQKFDIAFYRQAW